MGHHHCRAVAIAQQPQFVVFLSRAQAAHGLPVDPVQFSKSHGRTHIPLRLAILAFSLYQFPVTQFQPCCYLDPSENSSRALTCLCASGIIEQKGETNMTRWVTILYVIGVATFLSSLLMYAIYFVSTANFTLDLPVK